MKARKQERDQDKDGDRDQQEQEGGKNEFYGMDLSVGR
jgi:hypothetical protein